MSGPTNWRRREAGGGAGRRTACLCVAALVLLACPAKGPGPPGPAAKRPAQSAAPPAILELRGQMVINAIDGRPPDISTSPYFELAPGRRRIDLCLWVRWSGRFGPRYTALCRQTIDHDRDGERIVQEGGPFPDTERLFHGGRPVLPRQVILDVEPGVAYRITAQVYKAAISDHRDIWRIWLERRAAADGGRTRWGPALATVRVPAPGESYPPYARRVTRRGERPE